MSRRQRGVALITVLLVVAIVTVVCSGLIARQQLAIRATANQIDARQALHYAIGGEALAKGILLRDLKAPGANPQQPVDHPLEAWAKPLPVFPIEQGEIAVRIEDLSGRFNLNSLVRQEQVNQAALERFNRLLQLLEIDQPYGPRLVDWLDSNQEPSGEHGAEDNQYLLLQPPYRPANGPLTDVSELRLLLGMRDEDYRKLLPHVSVLPAEAALNVNTAGPLVLASLHPQLSVSSAQALIAGRGNEGYKDLQTFMSQPALAGTGLKSDGLAVGSQYFQVISEVLVVDRRQVLTSTLQRDAKGEALVLQRNLGQPALRRAPAKRNNEG